MLQLLRRTKIIATLGPATDQSNNLEKIITSGVNIVRLNFSHGEAVDHFIRANKVRKIASHLNRYIAILGDLQGPKIRISIFQSNQIHLNPGDDFLIDSANKNINSDQKYAGVNYQELPNDVSPGDCLLLDDGKIQLQVLKVHSTKIFTKVIIGGILFNNKGINKLGGGLSAKVPTNKDKIDIITAAKIGVDYLAISFPRNSTDLNYARELVMNAGSKAKIISKIERAEVVQSNETIDDIIQASDAVMVARGDLGVEIGESELVRVQKKIIQRAQELNKAVITATQMMESMITNSVPTRAEVMDVANAVLDGTDAVMLSAETATGQYPIKTVITMANVCLGAEKILHTNCSKSLKKQKKIKTIVEAISIATMYTANYLYKMKAVITITNYGQSTLFASRVNSKIPIFALSQNIHTLNMVTLYKGVIPIFFHHSGNNIIDARYASNILRDQGFLISGELVIVIQEDNIQNEHNINYSSHILQVD